MASIIYLYNYYHSQHHHHFIIISRIIIINHHYPYYPHHDHHRHHGLNNHYRSKLNLVDLAGSEKIPLSSSELTSTSKHIKELTSINKSLSSLGQTMHV